MTHDYTKSNRGWGHDITIKPDETGHSIEAMGWGRGLKKYDYILLSNGDQATRYQISTISYCKDPTDMFSADLKFAPRAGFPVEERKKVMLKKIKRRLRCRQKQ